MSASLRLTAYYRDLRGIQEKQDGRPIRAADGTFGSPADSLQAKVTGTSGVFRPVLADQGPGALWPQTFSFFLDNFRGAPGTRWDRTPER